MSPVKRVRITLLAVGTCLWAVGHYGGSLGFTPHPFLGPIFVGVFVGVTVDFVIKGLRADRQERAVWLVILLALLLTSAGLFLPAPDPEEMGQSYLYLGAFAASFLASATGYAVGQLKETVHGGDDDRP